MEVWAEELALRGFKWVVWWGAVFFFTLTIKIPNQNSLQLNNFRMRICVRKIVQNV